MTTLTRSAIITEAIVRAGRKAQGIPLTIAFDDILRKMSIDYPLLKNIYHPFTTVDGQSWVALPWDYRSREQCYYDDYELTWIEPVDYFYFLRTGNTSEADPNYYTIVKDEHRIYFWSTPGSAKTGYLYYASIHPKVEKTLAFTSGGTYQIKYGDVVTGVTSAKTMTVNFVRVTSGSWAGGDAAGYLLGTPSGAYQAENLNVGAETNVATIAGDATTADNFQHFFGDEFDDCVIEGVCWKALRLIKEWDEAREKKAEFLDLLADTAGVKLRKTPRVPYRGF
jgi:hypothetical protein